MPTTENDHQPATAAARPCGSCPYRRDVPSGVWDADEYAKLPQYDGDTYAQHLAVFMCHQQDGRVCAGWLGHRDPADLLAVRYGVIMNSLDPSALDYTTDVPLFASGAEAAAHGMAEYEQPGPRAQRLMTKFDRRR